MQNERESTMFSSMTDNSLRLPDEDGILPLSDDDWELENQLQQARLERTPFYGRIISSRVQRAGDGGVRPGSSRRSHTTNGDLTETQSMVVHGRSSSAEVPSVDPSTSCSSPPPLQPPHTSWRFYTSYDNGEWRRHAVPIFKSEEEILKESSGGSGVENKKIDSMLTDEPVLFKRSIRTRPSAWERQPRLRNRGLSGSETAMTTVTRRNEHHPAGFQIPTTGDLDGLEKRVTVQVVRTGGGANLGDALKVVANVRERLRTSSGSETKNTGERVLYGNPHRHIRADPNMPEKKPSDLSEAFDSFSVEEIMCPPEPTGSTADPDEYNQELVGFGLSPLPRRGFHSETTETTETTTTTTAAKKPETATEKARVVHNTDKILTPRKYREAPNNGVLRPPLSIGKENKWVFDHGKIMTPSKDKCPNTSGNNKESPPFNPEVKSEKQVEVKQNLESKVPNPGNRDISKYAEEKKLQRRIEIVPSFDSRSPRDREAITSKTCSSWKKLGQPMEVVPRPEPKVSSFDDMVDKNMIDEDFVHYVNNGGMKEWLEMSEEVANRRARDFERDDAGELLEIEDSDSISSAPTDMSSVIWIPVVRVAEMPESSLKDKRTPESLAVKTEELSERSRSVMNNQREGEQIRRLNVEISQSKTPENDTHDQGNNMVIQQGKVMTPKDSASNSGTIPVEVNRTKRESMVLNPIRSTEIVPTFEPEVTNRTSFEVRNAPTKIKDAEESSQQQGRGRMSDNSSTSRNVNIWSSVETKPSDKIKKKLHMSDARNKLDGRSFSYEDNEDWSYEMAVPPSHR